MNPSVLIDLIVSQLTVLIAQIATRSGMRLPLARVADEVFANLVRELQDQGVPQKVIADMFGLALRGYQARVRRLEVRQEDEERTLSMRVLRQIDASRRITRANLHAQFEEADEATLRSVLRDLVDSGVVYVGGKRDNPLYISASYDEDASEDERRRTSMQDMLVVCLYRGGEATVEELAQRLKCDTDDIRDALDDLMEESRVQCVRDEDNQRKYVAKTYHVRANGGAGAGWEAAVFDHVQAMSATIIQSLRLSGDNPRRVLVGGGTYSFDVWEKHPLYGEVTALLSETRARASSLRERVQAHNHVHGLDTSVTRVSFYCGQNLVEEYSDE